MSIHTLIRFEPNSSILGANSERDSYVVAFEQFSSARETGKGHLTITTWTFEP